MKTGIELTSAKSSRNGFTLIELLVVIAIIALLAAILFPVFARARENARRASCQSNLKQLGLGILQYTQDFDERLPAGRMEEPINTAIARWQDLIFPYVKSAGVYVCPSNPHKLNNAYTAGSNTSAPGVTFKYSYAAVITTNDSKYLDDTLGWNSTRVYAMPRLVPSSSNANIDPDGVHSSEFRNPAQSILLTETAAVPAYNGLSASGVEYNMFDLSATTAVAPLSHHFGMPNFLFADGHVKSLKIEATITPTNMWAITNGPMRSEVSNRLNATARYFADK